MFYFYLIAFTLLAGQSIMAQSTTRASNIGYLDSKLRSGKIISSTIGEAIIQTNRTKKNVQTNGFLQPIGKYFLMSSSENNSCLLWKIWPIPTQQFINIFVSSTSECQIKSYTLYIFNLSGQEIFSKICIEGTNEIDVSKISSGLYYFKLITNSNIVVGQKVIVIR